MSIEYEVENMEKKIINCKFAENVVEVMKSLVSGQHMTLNDGEGGIWKSECVDCSGVAITTLTKNNKLAAKIIYDYDSGREETFLM